MNLADSDLRERVRDAYSAAAERPREPHPFPCGRSFAESLGYPGDLLDSLPPASVEAFAGVSNVSLLADLAPGARVLDLGCGAGLDSLIAARRAGRVVGVDFSPSMLARARCAAAQERAANVLFCRSAAENLPLPDSSMDTALVNGIFNLNPARTAIFHELARVLRPDGAVYAAELILLAPPPERQRDEASWFA